MDLDGGKGKHIQSLLHMTNTPGVPQVMERDQVTLMLERVSATLRISNYFIENRLVGSSECGVVSCDRDTCISYELQHHNTAWRSVPCLMNV
ncbi:hypothetical protein E2C01_023506 [Portunus trituberculatus]|uniref:Uncharacterized protein n=1 Tax=Portunus trituberculatus TaxID=210409 RepID=A0A5B7EAQ5_PORTR|nr:hypothetical protein [Portunus trituberculatus]